MLYDHDHIGNWIGRFNPLYSATRLPLVIETVSVASPQMSFTGLRGAFVSCGMSLWVSRVIQLLALMLVFICKIAFRNR